MNEIIYILKYNNLSYTTRPYNSHTIELFVEGQLFLACDKRNKLRSGYICVQDKDFLYNLIVDVIFFIEKKIK